ncbi:MAG: PAS domain S-box protein [Solirubrobacterales bacterium]|nr:PAS domain S-box protein [Solirubrobacterales bacterium]
MRAARHRWLRSAASPGVAVLLLVVLLCAAGFLVTKQLVNADRRASARQRAAGDTEQLQTLLLRANSFIGGLGAALASEPAPNNSRFQGLVGSETGTFLLSDAMWVEPVTAGARRRYEATFLTGLPFPPGTDVSALPGLASTLQNSASGVPSATGKAVVSTVPGFFVAQGTQFGQGPRSQGSIVLFVPTSWFGLASTLNLQRAAISLDGRHLAGSASGAVAAGPSFEALNRNWRVEAAADPATPLQVALPWLALLVPLALALLVYLIVRGIGRSRRAERDIGEILDVSLDPLCIIGVDGYLKRVNLAFERTLGYAAAELIARPLGEFVHPDDRDATAASLLRLREGHGEESFESRAVRADGAVRWLQWNTHPLLERGLVYAAAHDITDIRTLAEEQAALRRVATLVAEGGDAADVFNAVSVEVGQLLGADATRLLRYESDGRVTIVARHGASRTEMGISPPPERDDAYVWSRVAESVRDPRADGAADGAGLAGVGELARGIGAAVASPILVSGRQWGVIVAAWKRGETVRRDTETRMGQFTELVATAVANAESRALLAASRQRIVATADETRRRLERDLHDGAQARLVNTVVALKLAEKAIGSEKAEGLVHEALENAERANEELRELARGIMPAVLTRNGLGPALEAVAYRSPIPVVLDLRTHGRLPEHAEVTTYFVISEALTNAAKHSHATAVHVTVEPIDGDVRLSIDDDGVGGADPARGSGLVGLRDRVEAIGGTLTVRSAAGEGTHVTVKLPMAPH